MLFVTFMFLAHQRQSVTERLSLILIFYTSFYNCSVRHSLDIYLETYGTNIMLSAKETY